MNRITSHTTNNKVLIEGPNKMDSAFFRWGVFYFFIFFSASYLTALDTALLLKAMFPVLLLLFLAKFLFRFQIVIDKNLVKVRKSFLYIRYVNVKFVFDEVRKVDATTIRFEKGDDSLVFENHNGFEIDTFLVIFNRRDYEIGDGYDSAVIFVKVVEAIESLCIMSTDLRE